MAERVLAIQAQDGRGARLAIRARTSALTTADVDSALNQGSLVISWLNRGTTRSSGSRKFLIPAKDDRAVVTTNEIFRPTILVDGQVAGVWKRPTGKIDLDPFRRLSAVAAKTVTAEQADVERFLAG